MRGSLGLRSGKGSTLWIQDHTDMLAWVTNLSWTVTSAAYTHTSAERRPPTPSSWTAPAD